MDVTLLQVAFGWVIQIIYFAVALFGVVGAALVVGTRDDAFDVADRQSKWIWAALLVVSSIAVAFGLPFLAWAGMVIIGLYWWDVRPQIKSILGGTYGY